MTDYRFRVATKSLLVSEIVVRRESLSYREHRLPGTGADEGKRVVIDRLDQARSNVWYESVG
jgi:hypothetical protein